MLTRDRDNQSQMPLDGNEVRSRVKCAVRLTDDDGTQAGDNARLSLNQGLANWRVNPRRWNRPLDLLDALVATPAALWCKMSCYYYYYYYYTSISGQCLT